MTCDHGTPMAEPCRQCADPLDATHRDGCLTNARRIDGNCPACIAEWRRTPAPAPRRGPLARLRGRLGRG